MMFAYAVMLAAGIQVCASTACDSNALLPKPNQRLDWHQMTGTWYETLKSVDVTNSQHACMSLSDVEVHAHGHDMLAKYYFKGGSRMQFQIHARYTDDGYYKQTIIEENEDLALKGGPSAKTNEKAAAGAKYTEMAVNTVLGDFRRYFASISCNSGDWQIWIFTKQKWLNPWLIVYIQNDLLKHGVSAPLQLGRCMKM